MIRTARAVVVMEADSAGLQMAKYRSTMTASKVIADTCTVAWFMNDTIRPEKKYSHSKRDTYCTCFYFMLYSEKSFGSKIFAFKNKITVFMKRIDSFQAVYVARPSKTGVILSMLID